jgi:hypothetical protein
MAETEGAPAESGPLSVDQAASRFDAIMGAGTEERPKKTEPNSPAETEGQSEPEAQLSDEQAEGQPEAEPAEAETPASIELPDTLDGLANALGIQPEQLNNLKVTVKVNGQERAVTLADAIKGHQLDADYRQKTAEIADQRRQFDAAVEAATHKWQERFQRADALAALLEQQTGAKDQAYWDAYLKDHGAEAYLGEKARWDSQMGALQQAQAEKQRLAHDQMAQTAQQRIQYRQDQQQKLAAADPTFANPAKAADFDKRFSAYLQETYKFTAKEVDEWVGGVWDHRHVLLAKKAMAYDDLQKAKPELNKKLANLPKVIVPGAARPKADAAAEANRNLANRARKTGKLEDVAKLFERRLG